MYKYLIFIKSCKYGKQIQVIHYCLEQTPEENDCSDQNPLTINFPQRNMF